MARAFALAALLVSCTPDLATSPGGPIVFLTVWPDTISLPVGGTARLTAVMANSGGIPSPDAPTWTTDDSATAAVASDVFPGSGTFSIHELWQYSPYGIVEGRRAGTTRVTATATSGERGTAVVRVWSQEQCVRPCWTTEALLPRGRGGAGVGVIGNTLYAVGGPLSTGFPGQAAPSLRTVEAFDPVSNQWTAKASMITGRTLPGVAVLGGILYAVGGSNETGTLASMEAYDPATDTWNARAPMPQARSLFGIGAANGRIYVVGGTISAGTVGTVLAYEPALDVWTFVSPLPTPSTRLGVGVVNGVLYAVGGSANVMEAYDPIADTWTARAPMPTARTLHGIGVLNGVLYAVGGIVNTATSSVVEAYDPAADTWTATKPMLTGRYSVGVGVVGGTLYAVGGANDITVGAFCMCVRPTFYLRANQAYRP